MQQAQQTAKDLDEGKVAKLQALALLHKWPDAAARSVIVVTALILAGLTWAHWGNIQVDCGRELYVPAELLRGKLLYRDVWYPYGPLEPYTAAVLLGLFGKHLYVFYLFGLTLATGCALLLFDVGEMLAGRAVGLTAAIVILLQGFVSSTFLYDSIFNYIFPYAYAATLGLLLALLCAFFAVRHVLGRTGRNLMLAGVAAGLALLCKPEFGVSCYIMLAFMLLADAMLRRSPRALLRGILQCAPGVAVCIVSYGWFFWKVTPGFILHDNWNFSPGSYFMKTHGVRYAAAVGLRFVPIELLLLVLDASIAILLWFGIAKFSAVNVRRFWSVCVAISVFVIGVAATRRYAPLAMHFVLALLAYPRGMFFIGCMLFIYSLHVLRYNIGDPLPLAKATFGIFALVLAVRVLANVVPSGYSIFYDVPLLLVFVISLKGCVETAASSLAIEQRRVLTNLILAIEVSTLAAILIPEHNDRTAPLDTSWGRIYLTPADAASARQIIDLVEEKKRQGMRVILLPELPIIYPLTGTEAPSRWYTLTPGFLTPKQEDDYVEDLERAAPDYIVLTNRRTDEYGEAYFGVDYDRTILRWIEKHYRATRQIGSFRRDRSNVLAALIYERRRANLPATEPRMPHMVLRPRKTGSLRVKAVPLST
jgi:hypothetical protein